MSRPIDADKLKRTLEIGSTIDPALERCLPTISAMVGEQPTLTYEDLVPHGRWKYYHKQNKAVCTNCSFERDLDANFGRAISCPNCGAKMDGGKDA